MKPIPQSKLKENSLDENGFDFEMSLEVIEVSKDGVHLIKAKYLRLSISMDGPVEMKFDSSDALDLKSPMGKIMGRVIARLSQLRCFKRKTLGFFVDESLNPLVKQQIEQSMKNFTIGTIFRNLQ